ncbi:hypothetical protein ABBQ32_002217 [Trebouxia sp. C0010 RCD-2024]
MVEKGQAPSELTIKACHVIDNLISAYQRKSLAAGKSEKDANFAAKSMLSFERLGSQENWPASHSDPVVKDSLQHLSNENTYLRQQLAARADTKFVQGILQKSVENVQLVHVGSNIDLADHCMKLESERVNLKREVYHLKLMLNSTYPGAMTVKFLQDQLAADMRLREYQSIQHNDVNAKLDESSTELKALIEDVSKLAEQNNLLLSLIDTKSFAPKQVSQANSAASDSPMIAAGIDGPFGKAIDSPFDPCLPPLHHHAQKDVRRQRNFRRGSRPRSAKSRNAPLHESRLNLSPDLDVPEQAEG